MTDPKPIDPLARLANQAEVEGRAYAGSDEAWNAACKGLEAQIKAGNLSQADVVQKLGRPNAGAALFNDGIAASDEKSWRAWRDAQPHRAERIRRAGK
jgi:hypothetical protein